jgi:competence protein ComEA
MIRRLFLSLLLALVPVAFSLSPQAAEIAAASQSQAVNINTADAGTLAQNLVGIGKSRAEEIVRYRDAYGPFRSVEDLLEVRGVGRSIVDKNRDRITLE